MKQKADKITERHDAPDIFCDGALAIAFATTSAASRCVRIGSTPSPSPTSWPAKAGKAQPVERSPQQSVGSRRMGCHATESSQAGKAGQSIPDKPSRLDRDFHAGIGFSSDGPAR